MVQLLKRISFFLLPVLFVSAGVLHFLQTGLLVKIVPPRLPAPRLLVHVSGVAELAGGVALLISPLRRFASWGLVLLLIAVFPANIYMAVDRIQPTSTPIPQWLLWARLPLQPLLIWWIEWTVAPDRRNSSV